MTITLYTTTSEKNAVNKQLVEITTLSGNLREETSVLTPVMNISGNSSIANANYAYIAEFNRYYFVASIESIRNGLWRLSFRVDVLYTYRDYIKANSAIIQRNEIEYDLKLNDGLFKTQQNPRIAQFSFPSGFTTWNFVLAVAGN